MKNVDFRAQYIKLQLKETLRISIRVRQTLQGPPCGSGSATNTALLQVEQAAGDAEWPAGDIHHQGPQEGHSQQEVKGKVYLLAGFRIRIPLVRIRIQNTGPDPDQLTWFNPDPIRIRNPAFYFLEHFLKSGVRLVGS
jgi:hypothetical protein